MAVCEGCLQEVLEAIAELADDVLATYPISCCAKTPGHHALFHGAHRESFADLLRGKEPRWEPSR